MEKRLKKLLNGKHDISIVAVENIKSNRISLFLIFVDCSNSMSNKQSAVRSGIKIIQNSLCELDDTSNIRVSTNMFGSQIYTDDLKLVENFNTSYSSKSEYTELYAAICYAESQVSKIIEKYGTLGSLNINVIFLSDGENCESGILSRSEDFEFSEAEKATVSMKENHADLSFYVIGNNEMEVAKCSRLAHELGFFVRTVNESPEAIRETSREIGKALKGSSKTGKPVSTLLSSGLSQEAIESYGKDLENVGVRKTDMLSRFFKQV